jgi:iron complex transport system ATP-binding protein
MALSCSNCTFAYTPGQPVVRGVSVALAAGRLTAIIGPNAGGKTTLLRLLAGLRRPDEGRVHVSGGDGTGTSSEEAVGDLSDAQRARRIVFVPQHSDVAFAFSTREIVALGHVRGDAQARGRGPRGGGGSPSSVDRALAELDLTDRADTPFVNLSAGQQQRATLARALVQIDAWNVANTEPRYLLADEPVSAMDPRHAVRSLTLLRALTARGIGVVCVLHDLALVLRFCDDAVLLQHNGTVLATGPARETLTPDRLGTLYGIAFETLRDDQGDAAAFIPRDEPDA